jgi:hypothetical protein
MFRVFWKIIALAYFLYYVMFRRFGKCLEEQKRKGKKRRRRTIKKKISHKLTVAFEIIPCSDKCANVIHQTIDVC